VIKDITFSKRIVKPVLIQGFMMMWASYLLAFLGRTEIAQTLSVTVCVEIVAVVLGYYLKAGVENVSKNTDWPAPNIEKGGKSCNIETPPI
jgi:hypothetical protein